MNSEEICGDYDINLTIFDINLFPLLTLNVFWSCFNFANPAGWMACLTTQEVDRSDLAAAADPTLERVASEALCRLTANIVFLQFNIYLEQAQKVKFRIVFFSFAI